jgi:WD40 repeat protein
MIGTKIKFGFLILLYSAMLFLQGDTWAESVESSMLLIETGRHSARITAISSTKDGSLFATSAKDKTVRIWNAAGRQVQVIRPPVGSRVNDAITSVALSPDGSVVAYQFSKLDKFEEKGNFVATFPIQVLNLKTQKIEHLVRTFEPVRLSFSPDSRFLAWISAFSSETGVNINVRRTSDWALYASSTPAKPDLESPARLDFSPDGNRMAVTFGNQVQVLAIKGASYASKSLFDASVCKEDNPFCAGIQEDLASRRRMVIEKTLKPAHGKMPIGVRWSPDGKWFAFGYQDAPATTLVSAGKWAQIELPATNLERAYINGPKTMATLTWSSDSKTLLSTGTMGAQFIKPTIIRQWSVGTKPTYIDQESTTGGDRLLAINNMVATSSGYAFASDDAIGFYEGGQFRVMEPYSGLRRNFSISNTADGAAFYFRFNHPDHVLGEPYVFDTRERTLKPEPSELPASFHVLDSAPGMEHSGMLSDSPILNGVRLEIDSHSGAFAFTPDSQTVLIGTSYTLYRFNSNGTKLWSIKLPAGAKAINTSRDGRLILVVLGDGTLRWYRLLDGKALLAFYVLNDRQSWVMWTPDGYFDVSDNSSSVLFKGVLRDNGLLETETLSLFSPMHRPDKIDAALMKLDVIGEAVPVNVKP